jgi:hypothetical protein
MMITASAIIEWKLPLVVASGDAAPVLEPADGAFDSKNEPLFTAKSKP